MPNLLLVMLGGALGAGPRYLVGQRRAGAVRAGLSLGDADRQPCRRPVDGPARRRAGAARRQRGERACSSASACSAASPPSPPSASRPSLMIERGRSGHRRPLCRRVGDRLGRCCCSSASGLMRMASHERPPIRSASFACRDGRRRHPPRPLVQAHLPEVELQPWSRAGRGPASCASTASAPRPATGSRRARPSACRRAEERARARQTRPPARPTLSDDEIAFVRSMVIHEDTAGDRGQQAAGPRDPGRHQDRTTISTACSTASPTRRGPRPKLVHRLDKDTSGVLLLARTPRAAAFFAKAFSGRTARKVYWAIVVGVPSIDDGMIELPLAKQPGTGGEKMHVDEEEGLAGAHPLPRDRARRQPRRLGRAPAAIPAAPTSCASTWRRSAIRSSATANMAGQDAFLTGGDQPQAAPPRAAPPHRPSRRRPDRRHRRAARAFRGEPGQPRLRSRARRPAARRGQIFRDARGQAQGGRRRRQGAPQGAQGRAPQPGPRLMHPNRAFAWQRSRRRCSPSLGRDRLLHDLRRRAGRSPMRR